MKVHLAEIFNFTCDRNPKHWWSADGIRPEIGQVLLCPYCGHENVVTETVNHTVSLAAVEVKAVEQDLPTIQDMIGILNVESDRTDSAPSDIKKATAMKKLIISVGYHDTEELENKLESLASDLVNGWLTDRTEQLPVGLIWDGEDCRIIMVDEITSQPIQSVHPLKSQLMWMTHNLIAHPLSEIYHWLSFVYKPFQSWGNWLHDATVPPHKQGEGRG